MEVEEPKQKYKILRGHKNGKPFIMRLDPKLQRLFHKAAERNKKNWDYLAIVSGFSGSGKSTFAMECCRALDPTFDINKVAFTADDFVRITLEVPEYSAVMLDESFADLNSKVTMSPEFRTVVNHLQLIRQKRLYLFLLLPNFFDLAKPMSLFRASHLFYVYEYENGERGRFRFYDRDDKIKLYVKGMKFMDYNAHTSTFFGQFWEDHVVDEELYLKKKSEHLQEQGRQEKVKKSTIYLAKILKLLIERKIFTYGQLEEYTGCNKSTLMTIKYRHSG